ncbi:hypothetical protein AAG570_001261 [Ranatra chinensis]|uniref:Reverse transcriptase domain-containing protein n=1 Tax=Ranatra chinensis TaxID=642074 RepID=A0ABD0YBM3_9HEMI
MPVETEGVPTTPPPSALVATTPPPPTRPQPPPSLAEGRLVPARARHAPHPTTPTRDSATHSSTQSIPAPEGFRRKPPPPSNRDKLYPYPPRAKFRRPVSDLEKICSSNLEAVLATNRRAVGLSQKVEPDPSSPKHFVRSSVQPESSSYRPISLLPLLSKVLEKLLLESQNIIPSHQFGFRSNHSTLQQCHRIVDLISSALEKKEYCGGVFLDVAQAFDRLLDYCLDSSEMNYDQDSSADD